MPISLDMRRTIPAVLAVAFVVLIIIAVLAWPVSSPRNDSMYQKGTLDDLMKGEYDGTMKVPDLLRHGDVGLGTFHGLNGEMVVLEGVCYQVTSDGTVNVVGGDMSTPFACVAYFQQDYAHPIVAGLNYSQMQTGLASVMADSDVFVFFIIHMTLPEITVRSVPAANEPYPALPEMIANQTIFQLTNVTGTLVGIYSPSFIGQIDSAGFHFHFISDDRSSGGHVLDLTTGTATAEMDEKRTMELSLN
ncbi:MAG TPA: acetolactate decarboxylase [Methanomassiliicoccales archaeon]|nr:acetolactate decarboxylase [Methanomassiliicoccales archaeon]